MGAGSAPSSEGGQSVTGRNAGCPRCPASADLLERALTHRSYAYENGGLPTNERLEFLGDSVLGLVVTDTLFREHPDLPEGQLAKLRAAVVHMRALAGVARGLNLGDHIRLGRGEEGTGGRDKPSILADTLEAVIGAVYLDRGLDTAGELVHRLFDPVIANSAQLGAGWTGRPRCRSSPRPSSSASRTTGSRRAARPSEVVPGDGAGRRPCLRLWRGEVEERGRAAGGRGRLHRDQRGGPPPRGAGSQPAAPARPRPLDPRRGRVLSA